MIDRARNEIPDLSGDVVLRVDSVSKKFCRNLKRSMAYGIKDMCCNATGIRQDLTRLRRDEFWALADVSLEIKRGEFLGIIGSNGSGKSTLLRLIAGIFPPDMGTVSIRGRVGALIALGAGFHPHMTGRENVYLNGAILGMDRDYIKRHFDQIVQFAEIGDFLEAPLATYSSGMRVRLGFAVAVHMAPEVLLVDEVLSVGDASFRERCYGMMTDYKNKGGTVIFISHNTVAVEQACDRVVWLERGAVEQEGGSAQVVSAYEQEMLKRSHESTSRLTKGGDATAGKAAMRLGPVECADAGGSTTDEFQFGQPVSLNFRYDTPQGAGTPHFCVGVRRSGKRGEYLSFAATNWLVEQLPELPRSGVVSVSFTSPNFAPGIYDVSIGALGTVSSQFGEKWLAPMRQAGSFCVLPDELCARFPAVPAASMVGTIPPAVQAFEWVLNGTPLQTSPDPADMPQSRP